MSEQNTTDWSPSSSGGTSEQPTARSSEQTGRTEYRRQVPHITQEPIDDIETEYVMPNRYAAADQTSGAQHKHMGVATSEPEYLPRTGPQVRQRTGQEPVVQGGGKHTAGGRQGVRKNDSLDYRYLETPKSGKSIFISREERRRKRNQRIAAVVAVVAVVVIVACLVIFL